MVLDYIIAFCGFVGGWLLVAGPIWQAAIELQEEEFDQEAMERARSSVPAAPRVSAWWWLIPPVAFVKRSRKQRAERIAWNAALEPDQLKQAVSFLNKANGWVIVAAGAFLLAIKETWELVERLDWPTWVFWVLIVVLPIAAIANAVIRQMMTQRITNPEAERPPSRRAKQRAS